MTKNDINIKSKNSYEIKPAIKINAPINEIWNYLINVESWWVYSNPEHSSLKIVSREKELREGTRISIKEKIAGIPCKANGIVTSINKHKLLRWEAVYSVFGLSWLKINAGVNWKLNELNDSITKLSANVWANFPDKFRYKLMWFFIKKIFNGIEKDYDHALTELRYLKSKLENK